MPHGDSQHTRNGKTRTLKDPSLRTSSQNEYATHSGDAKEYAHSTRYAEVHEENTEDGPVYKPIKLVVVGSDKPARIFGRNKELQNRGKRGKYHKDYAVPLSYTDILAATNSWPVMDSDDDEEYVRQRDPLTRSVKASTHTGSFPQTNSRMDRSVRFPKVGTAVTSDNTMPASDFDRAIPKSAVCSSEKLPRSGQEFGFTRKQSDAWGKHKSDGEIDDISLWEDDLEAWLDWALGVYQQKNPKQKPDSVEYMNGTADLYAQVVGVITRKVREKSTKKGNALERCWNNSVHCYQVVLGMLNESQQRTKDLEQEVKTQSSLAFQAQGHHSKNEAVIEKLSVQLEEAQQEASRLRAQYVRRMQDAESAKTKLHNGLQTALAQLEKEREDAKRKAQKLETLRNLGTTGLKGVVEALVHVSDKTKPPDADDGQEVKPAGNKLSTTVRDKLLHKGPSLLARWTGLKETLAGQKSSGGATIDLASISKMASSQHPPQAPQPGAPPQHPGEPAPGTHQPPPQQPPPQPGESIPEKAQEMTEEQKQLHVLQQQLEMMQKKHSKAKHAQRSLQKISEAAGDNHSAQDGAVGGGQKRHQLRDLERALSHGYVSNVPSPGALLVDPSLLNPELMAGKPPAGLGLSDIPEGVGGSGAFSEFDRPLLDSRGDSGDGSFTFLGARPGDSRSSRSGGDSRSGAGTGAGGRSASDSRGAVGGGAGESEEFSVEHLQSLLEETQAKTAKPAPSAARPSGPANDSRSEEHDGDHAEMPPDDIPEFAKNTSKFANVVQHILRQQQEAKEMFESKNRPPPKPYAVFDEASYGSMSVTLREATLDDLVPRHMPTDAEFADIEAKQFQLNPNTLRVEEVKEDQPAPEFDDLLHAPVDDEEQLEQYVKEAANRIGELETRLTTMQEESSETSATLQAKLAAAEQRERAKDKLIADQQRAMEEFKIDVKAQQNSAKEEVAAMHAKYLQELGIKLQLQNSIDEIKRDEKSKMASSEVVQERDEAWRKIDQLERQNELLQRAAKLHKNELIAQRDRTKLIEASLKDLMSQSMQQDKDLAERTQNLQNILDANEKQADELTRLRKQADQQTHLINKLSANQWTEEERAEFARLKEDNKVYVQRLNDQRDEMRQLDLQHRQELKTIEKRWLAKMEEMGHNREQDELRMRAEIQKENEALERQQMELLELLRRLFEQQDVLDGVLADSLRDIRVKTNSKSLTPAERKERKALMGKEEKLQDELRVMLEELEEHLRQLRKFRGLTDKEVMELKKTLKDERKVRKAALKPKTNAETQTEDSMFAKKKADSKGPTVGVGLSQKDISAKRTQAFSPVPSKKVLHMSEAALTKMITKIIDEKTVADEIDDRVNNDRQNLDEFVLDWLLNKYGIMSLAIKHLDKFRQSVVNYPGKLLRVTLFCALTGWKDEEDKLGEEFQHAYCDLLHHLSPNAKQAFNDGNANFTLYSLDAIIQFLQTRSVNMGVQECWAEVLPLIKQLPVTNDTKTRETKVDVEAAFEIWCTRAKVFAVDDGDEKEEPADTQMYKDMFEKYDEDGDGVLSMEEFRPMVLFLAPQSTNRQISKLFRDCLTASATGSDKMTFQGFATTMRASGLVNDESTKVKEQESSVTVELTSENPEDQQFLDMFKALIETLPDGGQKFSLANFARVVRKELDAKTQQFQHAVEAAQQAAKNAAARAEALARANKHNDSPQTSIFDNIDDDDDNNNNNDGDAARAQAGLNDGEHSAGSPAAPTTPFVTEAAEAPAVSGTDASAALETTVPPVATATPPEAARSQPAAEAAPSQPAAATSQGGSGGGDAASAARTEKPVAVREETDSETETSQVDSSDDDGDISDDVVDTIQRVLAAQEAAAHGPEMDTIQEDDEEET